MKKLFSIFLNPENPVNPVIYIFRSLFHYRKTHFAYFLLSIVLSCVLCGALGAGGQIKKRLAEMALKRTGHTDLAIFSGGNFFKADRIGEIEGCEPSSVFQTTGVAFSTSGSTASEKCVPVQIFGVEENFFSFFGNGAWFPMPKEGRAYVNRNLADKLKLQNGAEMILRLPAKGMIPADNPYAGGEKKMSSFKCVIEILPSDAGGDFSVGLDSSLPSNVFLPLDFISEKAGVKGCANICLFKAYGEGNPQVGPGKLLSSFFNVLELEDLGLDLKPVCRGNYLELRSKNVLIPEKTGVAALESGVKPFGIFTYFANSADCKDRSSPYSFVAGSNLPFMPEDMKDDEIAVTKWLAEDLGASVGDEITLRYFAPDSLALVEKSAVFKVRAIVPMTLPFADRDLAPGFEMLEKADKCADWDSSLPIDMKKIREKDEKYWDDFKATPKAFITLGKAQELWGSRFGKLTAVRYSTASESPEMIMRVLKDLLLPGDLGFEVVDIRGRSLDSVANTTDFASMFAGMSFFVVVSVLVLLYLLTAVSTGGRRRESGILLSLGFTRKGVLKLIFPELMLPVLAGTFAGVLAAPVVMNLFLLLLRRLPGSGDVFSSPFSGIDLSSARTAFLISIFVAGMTIFLTLRRKMGETAASLSSFSGVKTGTKGRQITNMGVSLFFLVVSLLLILLVPRGGGVNAAAVFFVSGFSFLLAGLFLFCGVLSKFSSFRAQDFRFQTLLGRNIGRVPGRSIAIFAMSAISVFILVAVSANRRNPASELQRKDSPSGGYRLAVRTAVPVSAELFGDVLASDEGQENVSFLPVMTGKGDMANCLNLNRIKIPRLAGVNPEVLNERRAFGFAELIEESSKPWLLLDRTVSAPDCIPGFVDQSVLQWGVGKKIGETIEYRAENGKRFNVEIAGTLKNTVFQGFMIISDKNFRKYFPSACGYGMFLADCPENMTGKIWDKLSFRLQDYGVVVSSPSEILSSFSDVEGIYLDVFMALGALGVLIGTAGLGLAVARNILDRGKEIAVMGALGFSRRLIKKYLVAEHFALFSCGIFWGFLSAIVALIPVLTSNFGKIPLGSVFLANFAILAVGLISVLIPVFFMLRSGLTDQLRAE